MSKDMKKNKEKKNEAKQDETKKKKEVKEINKTKKETKKQETILEVNEITKESVEAETLKMLEKEQKEKEKADRLRKEKVKKTFNKIFKGYDINNIVKVIMWIFFAIISLYVSFSILKQNFNSPALKVFIAEESLEEIKKYNIKNVDNISINLDSFDVSVRESESDEIIIKYNRKYDKKVKIDKKDKSINIVEKNKIFKIVRFDSTNNVMIVEIPKKYKGSLEVQSKNGLVKLEQYKIVDEENNLNLLEENQDFYKNFFNI